MKNATLERNEAGQAVEEETVLEERSTEPSSNE
jgi:hypothetical protein